MKYWKKKINSLSQAINGKVLAISIIADVGQKAVDAGANPKSILPSSTFSIEETDKMGRFSPLYGLGIALLAFPSSYIEDPDVLNKPIDKHGNTPIMFMIKRRAVSDKAVKFIADNVSNIDWNATNREGENLRKMFSEWISNKDELELYNVSSRAIEVIEKHLEKT